MGVGNIRLDLTFCCRWKFLREMPSNGMIWQADSCCATFVKVQRHRKWFHEGAVICTSRNILVDRRRSEVGPLKLLFGGCKKITARASNFKVHFSDGLTNFCFRKIFDRARECAPMCASQNGVVATLNARLLIRCKFTNILGPGNTCFFSLFICPFRVNRWKFHEITGGKFTIMCLVQRLERSFSLRAPIFVFFWPD